MKELVMKRTVWREKTLRDFKRRLGEAEETDKEKKSSTMTSVIPTLFLHFAWKFTQITEMFQNYIDEIVKSQFSLHWSLRYPIDDKMVIHENLYNPTSLLHY